MPDPLPTRPGSRHARVRFWAERLLTGAGAAALVWCAAIVGDAVIAQRTARSSLEAAALVEPPLSPPRPVPATDRAPHNPFVTRGSAIGALSIPRVALSAVVLHGSDAQTLRRGPGHLEHTALPGTPGNAVIAGHRDTFFWPLRNIQPGDDIFLDTPDGRFHYRVSSVRVVNPRDVSVLASTTEPTLTLITCYPFWVFGDAPDRLVVRATAVGGGAVAAATADVDDEVLVRLAVERYRLTYNGRLISRRETGSDGLLKFKTCEVTVAGDRATAVCESGVPPASTPEPGGRTFRLERGAGGWAIKSIVVT